MLGFRWLVVSSCALLLATAALAAEPEYRWKAPTQSPNVSVSADLLSADDRAYLAALPEIRVAVYGAGAVPYEVVAPNGEISGFQVDVLLLLAQMFNVKVRPVVYDTWPAVLQAVRDKQADMVLNATVTADRLDYIAFTLGTVPVPAAVFARAGVTDQPPVTKGTFALERGYASHDSVSRRFPQATTLTVESRADAVRAVLQGRADYYLGSILETADVLASEKLKGLELRFAMPMGSGFYHLGIRKDWARLATIFNRAISSVRMSGARGVDQALAQVPGAAGLIEPLTLTSDASRWLAQTSVLRVGAVRGLALLNDVGPDGTHSGVAADYLEHVAQRLGVGLEIVPFDSFAAMLAAMREQRIHVVPLLTKTAQREREFRYSAPYLSMPFVLVARSDAPAYWDLGSLRGRRIALDAEHPLRAVIAQRYPEVEIVGAANSSEAMALVVDRKADATVELKNLANLRVNEGGGGQLRTLGEVADLPAAFHFALASDAAPLLPAIDQSLADIAPGERERMLRRWVAVDQVPGFAWRRWGPALGVAAAALLSLFGATLWWTRRLASESAERQRALELIDDIGRALPGCNFRYVFNDASRLTHAYVSSGSESFLGEKIPAGQPLHDTCLQHVDAEQRPAMAREMREALASRDHFERVFPYNHPDGRKLWLYIEALRGKTPEGQTTWTGYLVDVTQRHLMQQRIERESDERYLLLATASHELRAPAHTLVLALQTMADAERSSASGSPQAIARDAAKTLVQLLDEVLDMARTRYGRIEIRPQHFNLHALFEQVANSQAGLIAEKGLRFTHQIAPGVPRTVCSDPLRVKQILTNVLNNAAKYTERGGIDFSLRVEAPGSPGAQLRFVVADTGVGIPAEERKHLFQPFSATFTGRLRADLRTTGLGLANCQRLLGLMRGTLKIDSVPQQGTSVEVSLPLGSLSGTQVGSQVGTRVVPAAPLRSRGAILVCDDDEVSAVLLAEMLRHHGHEVVLVNSAIDALALWRLGGVSAVITDLNMPAMGGAELMERIRTEEAAASTRTALIVCTGDPAPALGAQAPHFDIFISKPVDMRVLSDALAALGLSPAMSVAMPAK
jgi:two-component system, NarL family, sensor histidine kinase EvgS